MVNINIDVPKEVHRKIKVACALRSTTLIEFVHTALSEKIAKEQGKGSQRSGGKE